MKNTIQNYNFYVIQHNFVARKSGELTLFNIENPLLVHIFEKSALKNAAQNAL